MTPMYIIKLGGSVITDKSKPYFFKQKVADRLAREIKKADQEIILVHGAGSFGHILAKEYQLNQGFKNKKQLTGFSLTQEKVQQLNTMMLTILHNHNIPAVAIPPHAFLELTDHVPKKIDFSLFNNYIDQGFIPVTFGDVVLDKKIGFSICSGDLLMLLLAKEFKAEKIIFVVDEDGLYTANPKKDKHATLIQEATLKDLNRLTTSMDGHADVTKGMAGKLETISEITKLGIDTILLNGNKDKRLYDILVGNQTVCTHIHGEKR
jgi:isopentenyl phosphate kinase